MHVPRTPLLIADLRPEDGRTLLTPGQRGPGNWVGAASVVRDPANGRTLVAYRERSPDTRGHRCVIAELRHDGVREIWNLHAAAIGSASIERPALTVTQDGTWRLYFSYVEPTTQRWQIDVLEAGAPEHFEPHDARAVLTASQTGTEGVKDPYVLQIDGVWFLFVNAVQLAGPNALSPSAGVGGDVILPTGLATSLNGFEFAWHGTVLPVGTAWDARMARLTAVVRLERGYLGFYDGRATAAQNFEEQLGLAYSADLTHWLRLTPYEAWRRSPEGGGALRYLDALEDDGTMRLVYEYARADGSHELRENRLPLAG